MSVAESPAPQPERDPSARATAPLARLGAIHDESAALLDEDPAELSHPRDRAIPVRRSRLLEALIARGTFGSGERERFHRLARMLALIYHYEFFDRLDLLHEAYHHFDPDREAPDGLDPADQDEAYEALRAALLEVLRGANFIEISHAEVERAHKERAVVRVELRAEMEAFREVRLFRRGRRRETLKVADWYGLRKRSIEADVYDDVVLFVGMKPKTGDGKNGGRLRRKARRLLRPGCVLLKSFRNIASADLNALLPNIRVVMSTLDRLILTIPAIAGGVPIIINLASTVTVLFLVAGFYLGLSGAVNDNDMKKALAAMSGLVALGAFLMRQWVKYQRQTLRHQKELADNIYYRNVNNNAGLFDSLIGAAEEQDCKEAFLACYFLLTAQEPMTEAALDRRIEQWLKDTFAVDIDFESDDALAKLDRLGLIHRDGEHYAILPMDEVIARLEAVWAGMFKKAAA